MTVAERATRLALDGLKVGLDAFQSRIEDEDLAPAVFTRARSCGVYAAYGTDAWETIAEFHVFDDLQSALKFELADTHITGRDVGSFSDVLLQYAIRF